MYDNSFGGCDNILLELLLKHIPIFWLVQEIFEKKFESVWESVEVHEKKFVKNFSNKRSQKVYNSSFGSHDNVRLAFV